MLGIGGHAPLRALLLSAFGWVFERVRLSKWAFCLTPLSGVNTAPASGPNEGGRSDLTGADDWRDPRGLTRQPRGRTGDGKPPCRARRHGCRGRGSVKAPADPVRPSPFGRGFISHDGQQELQRLAFAYVIMTGLLVPTLRGRAERSAQTRLAAVQISSSVFRAGTVRLAFQWI